MTFSGLIFIILAVLVIKELLSKLASLAASKHLRRLQERAAQKKEAA
jgi:hypothetical protein